MFSAKNGNGARIIPIELDMKFYTKTVESKLSPTLTGEHQRCWEELELTGESVTYSSPDQFIVLEFCKW